VTGCVFVFKAGPGCLSWC